MEPLTHDSPKKPVRVWKLCRCVKCGKTAVCTPKDDFYIREKDQQLEQASLYCEACFLKDAGLADAKIIEVEL